MESGALKILINPFDKGVTYEMFLDALGKKDVSTYLKGTCTDAQIEFVKKELELINKNKK
jgi:hypothetical protein